MAASFLSLCLGILVLYSSVSCTAGDHSKQVTGKGKRSLGDQISKKTWKTVGTLTAPYMMLNAHSSLNETKFQGFIPDLLEELSHRLGITFDIYLVPDGRYGSQDVNGTWNGMIGEVIKMENNNGGADLAAAPLTITHEREEVVNFVKPFQHQGLTILMKKLIPAETTTIFRGISPDFPLDLLISMLLVALVLWLMNKFNPNEWGQLYSQGRVSKEESESFTYAGALWYTFTILQWQGFDRHPKSLASRLLTCVWFTFVVIALMMYLMTMVCLMYGYTPSYEPEVISLTDLARQTEIRYGVVKGGSAYSYLTALAKTHKDIRRFVNSYEFEHFMVNSNEDGVRRARQGYYAFIVNSLTAEYVTQRHPCDLRTVSEVFAIGHTGMALPNNVDPETMDAFNSVILEMHESSFLEKLRQKWWYDQGECETDSREQESLNQMPSKDLRTLWPLFAVLAAGILATVVASLVELIYFQKKGKLQEISKQENKELEL